MLLSGIDVVFPFSEEGWVSVDEVIVEYKQFLVTEGFFCIYLLFCFKLERKDVFIYYILLKFHIHSFIVLSYIEE